MVKIMYILVNLATPARDLVQYMKNQLKSLSLNLGTFIDSQELCISMSVNQLALTASAVDMAAWLGDRDPSLANTRQEPCPAGSRA